MFLAKLAIERPVLATMLIMVFVVFGFIAYRNMNLEEMPEMEIPIVTIQTIYAGASPEIVESQVTDKIEDAISTVSEIDKIESYSIENFSLVVVQFLMTKDDQLGLQEIKDKIDAILNNLPGDVEKPEIEKVDPFARAGIEYVLSGELSDVEMYDLAHNVLKEEFSKIPGVAKVEVDGGVEREIQIAFKQNTVKSQGISLPAVSQILSSENLDMSGGSFEVQSERLSTKLEGEFNNLDELEAMRIPTAYGMRRLRELAEVTDGKKEQLIKSSYYDNLGHKRYDNIIRLGLIIGRDGNVVKVDEEADNRMDDIKKLLPAGTNLIKIFTNADHIHDSVKDTVSNILMGILLTALILLFFLHDLRSTLIAAISMPVSLISSFFLMGQMGYTMNIITLMALSTSVGILVTNAVVVLENIFRHKHLGENRRNSAQKGTSEVTIAVIASAMTNIAVFLPLASLHSIVGSAIRPFAMTVVFATLFSLLISFTLTPMLASRILPEKPKRNKVGESIEKLFKGWENFYGKTLKLILGNRWISSLVIVISIVLLIMSFQLAKQLGFEFSPHSDVGSINVRMELPPGTDLTTTEQKVQEVEDIITKHKEVKHILSKLGEIDLTTRGTHVANLSVKLININERELSTLEVSNILMHDLEDVRNVLIRIGEETTMSMGSDPVEFSLTGFDPLEMQKLNEQIVEILKDVPGLTNFDTSSKEGNPQVSFIPDRERMAEYGVSISDLAYALRSGLEGFLASSYYKENNNEYEIRVSYSDAEVNTPEEIGRIPVVTQRGIYTLAQFCEIRFTETASQVQHLDKIRAIKFTGGVANGYSLSEVNGEINKRLDNLNMPVGYSIDWGGNTKMMNENLRDMAFVLLIAIIMTYMLLAAILESFLQPFIILATLPLAMIGVFTALYITGITINMISMLSIIMLVGIVVNNAILIMDYTNQLIREKNYSSHDALIEAAPTKLKPVLMTTLAIILGMLPMALGMGASGKEFRQPMGVVSIGGLLVSSILTLYVIPAIFLLTTRKK
ncbi:MAG: efflux RND transporter permease subunit [Candidatus Stygibacter frigidus]|nr:efflux RND transporter permease subunit [Candidatus Stygibacter frigidus]